MLRTEDKKSVKKYSKPQRGRKSPKRITIWENRFSKKLRKNHGNFHNKSRTALRSTDAFS